MRRKTGITEKLEARAAALQKESLYRMMASTDPEMQALIDELDSNRK